MTLITFEDGRAVFRDGAVGTEQACCCDPPCSGPCDDSEDCPPGCECVDGECVEDPADDNSCTNTTDCGCYATWPVTLQGCSEALENACNAIGGRYECIDDGFGGAGECFGWLDDPECLGPGAVSNGLWFTGFYRPCCGNQCCQEEFDEYLERTSGKNGEPEVLLFDCCDDVCTILEDPFECPP